MIDNRNEMYKESIRLWGKDAQLLMVIEEAAELIQAILHYWRRAKDSNVLEEAVDMEIMLEQLKIIFDFSKGGWNGMKEYKLKKLRERLDKI